MGPSGSGRVGRAGGCPTVGTGIISPAGVQKVVVLIYAAPDDDAARLVFADWLDERGSDDDKARAALIRAQCQAEILPKGSKERKKLEKQAKEILKEYEDRWTQKLRDANLGIRSTFRRGFIDLIEMSATVFTHNAKKLFEIAPTIRSAYFPDASNEVGRLAKCEFFARLASVDIHAMCKCGYCPIQNDLRALFTSKHTTGLTALNIAGELAINEMTQRALRTATLSFEGLRHAGDADRSFRKSQVDAAVRFCAKVLGREYAALLGKAAEVASAAESKAARA